MLGPEACKTCGKKLQDDSSGYCKSSCVDLARRTRDRDRKRSRRGYATKVDPAEFFERDPPYPKAPDIQPRAYMLVQQRAIEFIRWLGPNLAEDAARFCFMRGYSELDRQEILKSLRGETKVAPEEIPPDPPDELEPALVDVFAE